MNCSNCGNPIPEGAKFCQFCGAFVAEPEVKKEVAETEAVAEVLENEAVAEVLETESQAANEPATETVNQAVYEEPASKEAVAPENPPVSQPTYMSDATSIKPLKKGQWLKTEKPGLSRGFYITSKIIAIITAILFIIVGIASTAAGLFLTTAIEESVSADEYDENIERLDDFRKHNKSEYKAALREAIDEIDEALEEIDDAIGVDIDLDLSYDDLDDFYKDYYESFESKRALTETCQTFFVISAVSLVLFTTLLFVACFSKNIIVAAVGLVLSIAFRIITPFAISIFTVVPFALILICNIVIALQYKSYKEMN